MWIRTKQKGRLAKEAVNRWPRVTIRMDGSQGLDRNMDSD